MKKLLIITFSVSLFASCRAIKLSDEMAHKNWLYRITLQSEAVRAEYIKFLELRIEGKNIKDTVIVATKKYDECGKTLFLEWIPFLTSQERNITLSNLLTKKNLENADTLYLLEAFEKSFFWINGMNPDDSIFYYHNKESPQNTSFKSLKKWTLGYRLRDGNGRISESLGRTFYDWAATSENQPCKWVANHSQVYLYTVFVRKKENELGFECIKSVIFIN